MEEGKYILSHTHSHTSALGANLSPLLGDARSGNSSYPHVVCTPVQPSSTPVSLRYHFAVSGACSIDSSADPSDNLLSGYLYSSPSRGRNADTFKDPGRHTARKWLGLELVSRWEQNSRRWRPHPTRHAPFLRGVQPMSKCSCCASRRQPPPHSHRCKHRPGVLLRLWTSQTCIPAKLCASANP